LAPNTWLIKLLGEFLKYDGVSLILEIKNEIKNAELSNLKKLYLTKKKIESADIENSKNLEELHLFSNDILSFEIKHLKRLFIHKIDDLIIHPGTFDKCINLTEI
jgi:Leucine-rich repeat (LRR) protein